LFPEKSRLLLTGGGKEFIERIGVEATRRVIHHVMMGENLRSPNRTFNTQARGASKWRYDYAVRAGLPED
jgi:hypothetical protein